MLEDFLAAMEQMTDEEFVHLLDDVRPFSNVGPSVDEYMDFVNANFESSFTFVYNDEQSEMNANNDYCLAA